MKTCSKCKKPKPLEDFALNRSKKDGRQDWCRECKKESDEEYYQNNKKYFMARAKDERKRNMDYIRAVKDATHCHFCQEAESCVLEFHHRDPSQKEESIALIPGRKWCIDRLQKEIDKCVVLCANCHRKLHAGILRL